MKSCSQTQTSLMMSLVASLVVLQFSFISGLNCPSNCTCSTGHDDIKCSDINTLPSFENKSLIKKLDIEKHGLTTLSRGVFSGFSSLAMLSITHGTPFVIEPGALDDIKNTIVRVDFEHNQLTDIPAGLFVNMSNLNEIELKYNELTSVHDKTFVNLPKLITLDLAQNKLSHIDDNAFVDLAGLETLELSRNVLRKIPFTSFVGLVSLKDLRLIENRIDEIPSTVPVFLKNLDTIDLGSNLVFSFKTFPNISSKLATLNLGFIHTSTYNADTWKYLGNLKYLMLNGAKIRDLTVGMFDGLTNLENLQIMYSELLKNIGPDAFRGLKNLKNIDLRSNHRLEYVDPSAFIGAPNIETFFMTNTSVTFLPQHLVKWYKLSQVNVQNNPLACDCKSHWMLDTNNFGKNENVRKEFHDLYCASPEGLKGKKIGTLTMDQLTCKSPEMDHKSRAVTGVIVAVICLVLFGTLFLVTYNRKGIELWCRRQYQYRRYKSDMVFTVEQDTSIAELEDGTEGRPLKNLRLETVPL